MYDFSRATIFLANMIEKDKGIIVGPISVFLGWILNFFYNVSDLFFGNYALGFSIILLTVVVKTLLLPFGIKTHKSMIRMQEVQPELDKIKKKYEGTKDPELQRKMQMETQAIYSKYKINPVSGCLPSLMTLPVFIGLNYSLRQTYQYVGRIGELYNKIAESLISIPEAALTLRQMIFPMLPNGMQLYPDQPADLSKALNKFTPDQWQQIFDFIKENAANAADKLAGIEALYADKLSIESFFGLSLVDTAGLLWPGILIPILSAFTTFLSTYLMQKRSKSNDQTQKTQQMVMMVVMPLFIFYATINMTAGVGVYWVVSNIYQIIQQQILNKLYSKNDGQGQGHDKTNPTEVKEAKTKTAAVKSKGGSTA